MVNRKGESMSLNKLITIILVVMVVAALLLFTFRSQIRAYLTNLPGFQYDNEDKEITVTEKDLAVLGCNKVGYFGRVEGTTLGWGGEQYIYLGTEKTRLYVNDGFTDSKIFLDNEKWWSGDSQVGSIADSKISISGGEGLTSAQLKSLEGSQTKGNLIVVCP